MLKPAILARDTEFIKDILTTNFNSFRNNDTNVSKIFDPLTATNPFFAKTMNGKTHEKPFYQCYLSTKYTPTMR